MKKLNKLHLNTGKLLRKEELIQLKGGYDGCNYHCIVREYYHGPIFLEGDCCLESADACCIYLANLYHLDITCAPI